MTTTEYHPTETDHHNGHSSHDHGAPATGSGAGAPSVRRQRAGKPAWTTLLENPHTRKLIASQLGIRAEQLRAPTDGLGHSAEQTANDDLAEMVADVVRALRA